MKEKVIVIVGPTGVGKSAYAVELAKQLQGEIISGDSMQVYQEMSIGTAKITKEEMQGVPHHLVDCYSIQEEYNVKVFQEEARKKITEIHERGHIPIVCGGTGLYIKALLYDYVFQDQPKDESFHQFLESLSNSQLYHLLRLIDEEALEKIHKNNRQRLIRALEIAHHGETKSSIENKQEHRILYDVYLIGLTMDREKLYERINQRVDIMMKQGLWEEIQTLAQIEGIWDLQSMQSIGYKEWKAVWDGTLDKDACVEMIKKNSRNFAKRQYTWFNNQMPMQWVDVLEKDWKQIQNQKIMQWLKKT